MMKGLRTFWACPLILLILSLSGCLHLSEARHHNQKDPSAVVVGTVYCDTCFQDDFSKASHYISGATVAVECAQGNSRPAFHQEVKTDKQGKFKVHLPFMVSKHVKEIEGCTVKLVKSGEPYCAVASTASSSAIHLKEKKRGKHVFSAGFFTFKPLKQPGLCSQKPSVTKSNLNSFQGLLPDPGFPTIPNPLTPTGPDLPLMPPLPDLPHLPTLPPLPPLPPLPGLPGIPAFNTIPQKPVVPSEEKHVRNEEIAQPQFFFPPVISPPSTGLPLPPNPLQPPPLVPNPFQPPPAPLIPNPFQPPSPPPSFLPPLPPLPNFPPIPGLTPTPSSPPPAPTFPFPPLPPLIPGVPPVVPGIPIPPVVPGIPMPPASANPKKITP